VNDSVVLLVSSLTWPIVVLFISALLLLTQRKALGGLIGRISKASFPGGGLELRERDATTISSLIEALPQDTKLALIRQDDSPEPGDAREPSPEENREALDRPAPLPTGDVDDLVMLRTRIANLLSEIAFPPPPAGTSRVPYTIGILHNRGVLSRRTANALQETIKIADQASAGAAVPKQVATAVGNSGQAILEQIAQLRATAAARSEEHILEVLRNKMPRGWSVDMDAPVGSSRVDALVQHNESSAVVEVRTRLHSGDNRQIEALRQWFSALSKDMPVLLVFLGGGLNERTLRQVSEGHSAEIRVVLWDDEAATLMSELSDLIELPRHVGTR
jgi:hypothetical protein